MELYRVLLVDDEEDIREGISRKMDWLGLGFSLVGEAANGQDALELAESLRPDVILTDIKMPFMDGLELCRILTDRLPAARFVVFSGFDAFEYAKQAIQMNVVEYILKPINADELSAVLRRLKDQLDRERAERRNVELLRSRYTENLPVLRELFYANLLDGHIEPGTERERAVRLDIDLQGEEWAVGLAYIGSDRRDALSTLSVQKLLEESLTADRCRLTLYNDWVAVIVSLTESFTIYDLIRVLDRVCTLAASYLGLTLTVGVGAPCKELSGMARSAAEARTALEYRSMVGRGQVIYIGDLEPDGGQVLTFEEADERTLTAAVRLGSEQEVRDAAAALAGKIREANPSAGQYNLFLMELVTHLMKMTRRSGFRHGLFLTHSGLRAAQSGGTGGLVRGALSAAPHADPPPSDGFGGTDGGNGQGVYPAALRGERPVGGKAVRVSAFKFHLFFHAVQTGNGDQLHSLCYHGADGGGCGSDPRHRGENVSHRPAVRL